MPELREKNFQEQEKPLNAALLERDKIPMFSPAKTSGSVNFGFSRDEMNLAEFPLTVLSTRSDPKIKTLEFSDQLRNKDGELIERKWIITGADKFGLPTATDDDVILGLIRLSMDEGFRDRKIYFTRYELLKALQWTTEGRNYGRLTKSLDRLSGVRIRATNSFYDNSSKSYQTCNFGIIDAYEINDNRGKKEGENSGSFFIWSEMIFDSFKSGFIKKIDLDLYFSLNSAVSRRLYRYLDKHFYYRSVIEKPLMEFAFEKLGLSRTYRYVSSVKQQIEPACEELIRVGFLSSYEVLGKGEGSSIKFIAGNQGSLAKQANINSANNKEVSIVKNVKDETDNSLQRTTLRDQIFEAIVSRGISIAQSKRLLSEKPLAELKELDNIIQYYDSLVENNDPKVSRNKVGFLYRAVEAPYKFSVPPSFAQQKNTTETLRGGQKRRENKVFRAEEQDSSKEQRDKRYPQYQSYLEDKITQGLRYISPKEIETINESVEKKMSCLKNILSEKRFQEALSGCVREELKKRLELPDFNGWLEAEK